MLEHRSFTGAARQLGYTQSGISQQIAALERIADRNRLIQSLAGAGSCVAIATRSSIRAA